MSKFYRNRGGFWSALTKGSGLYWALGVTGLIVLSLAALFLPGEPAAETVVPPDTDLQVSVPSENTDTVSDFSSEDSSQPSSDGGTEDSQDRPAETVMMILPVSGTVGTDFSLTVPVFSETMKDWRVHQGIDYLTEGEAEVVAVADGMVDQVYVDELMGLTVEILHADGTRSIYQSLGGEASVIAGQEVRQGDKIGSSGISADSECLEGNHLHFALLRDGVYLDPNERFIP